MPKKNILLIGDVGSGKTGSLETLPGGLVLFNFDPGGWTTLDRPLINGMNARGRKGKRVIHTSSLREWLSLPTNKLESSDVLVINYEYVDIINPGILVKFDQTAYSKFVLDANLLETQGKGRGICHFAIDSLTGLQVVVRDAIVVLNGRILKGTSQDDYGKAIEKMDEIITSCCHAPFDFILTAHYQSDKDEIVGKVREELMIYGKSLPQKIPSKFDDIYFCEVDLTGVREWRTDPQMYMRIIRQRSFDNLPIRVTPNFTELYKGRLYCE